MSIETDLLDQLIEERKRGDLFGKDGSLRELATAPAERGLRTELDLHLTIAFQVLTEALPEFWK